MWSTCREITRLELQQHDGWLALKALLFKHSAPQLCSACWECAFGFLITNPRTQSSSKPEGCIPHFLFWSLSLTVEFWMAGLMLCARQRGKLKSFCIGSISNPNEHHSVSKEIPPASGWVNGTDGTVKRVWKQRGCISVVIHYSVLNYHWLLTV